MRNFFIKEFLFLLLEAQQFPYYKKIETIRVMYLMEF